jgi:hypothetical protein
MKTKTPTPKQTIRHSTPMRQLLHRNNPHGYTAIKADGNNPQGYVPELNPDWRDEGYYAIGLCA